MKSVAKPNLHRAPQTAARRPMSSVPYGRNTVHRSITDSFVKHPIRNTLLTLATLGTAFDSYSVVEPGTRGVRTTMGAVSEEPVLPGVTVKWPFFQRIHHLSVKARTNETTAKCFSKDLQEMDVEISILWGIPDQSAVRIFRDYQGEPFEKLVKPRAQEAIKEITIEYSAQDFVAKREEAKRRIADLVRSKVHEVEVLDVNVENVNLSDALEEAIDKKMVQEQRADQARFEQQLREIQATIDVIKSLGEAGAIAIQGEALKLAPEVLALRIAQKWNGRLPEVVGVGKSPESGETDLLLPIGSTKARSGEERTMEQILAQLEAVKQKYVALIEVEKAKYPEER